MASIHIAIMREKYPGKTDIEAAKDFAREFGYIAVIRYKSTPSAPDYTNVGVCKLDQEISGYLTSPYCHAAEIIFDGRSATFQITEDLILKSVCALCGRKTSQASLTLNGGNNFTFCPKCGKMFCDGCYMRLPLNRTPGYGTCPDCRVEVKRAIPGIYGAP